MRVPMFVFIVLFWFLQCSVAYPGKVQDLESLKKRIKEDDRMQSSQNSVPIKSTKGKDKRTGDNKKLDKKDNNKDNEKDNNKDDYPNTNLIIHAKENVCNLNLWRRVRDSIHEEFGPGPCGPLARASVRLAFHDAGTYDAESDTGGANGSILRFKEENEQPQNDHLKTVIDAMNRVYRKHRATGVSRADIVQLAGVLGTVRCPGGPSIPFSVGRPDTTTPDKASNLPSDTASADEIIRIFARMGLDADEMVALIGSHTTAKRFHSDPRKHVKDETGLALDSTPEIWDVKYYAETLQEPKNNLTETRIAADINIARHWKTSKEFARYAHNQRRWNEHFSDAMVHMANLGHHKRQLVPCPIVPAAIRIPGDDIFEPEVEDDEPQCDPSKSV